MEVTSLNRNVVAPLYITPPSADPDTSAHVLYFPPHSEEQPQNKPKMDTKLKLKIGGIFFIVTTVLTAVLLSASMHVIDEGHVGIYFKQGALVVIFLFLSTSKSS